MALGAVAAAGFSFAGGLYGKTLIFLTAIPQPGRPSGTLRLRTYDAASQQPVTGADEAPFVVAPVDDEANEVKLCWRGRRLPSHAPNCTGCDCAVWTLKLDGDVLHSTFQMSPPAIHLSAALTRSGPAPAAVVLRRNWNCTFDNATQHPDHPLLPPGAAPRASNLSCPFLARAMTEQPVCRFGFQNHLWTTIGF